MRRRDDFGAYLTDGHIEIAKSNGIRESTLNARLGRGWRVERAITSSPNRRSEEYHKHRKIAEAIGIGESTFKHRVYRGWSLEEASTLPLFSPQEKGKASAKNKKRIISKRIEEMAKANGISYKTLSARMRRWRDPVVCATHPLIKPGEEKKGLLKRYGYIK